MDILNKNRVGLYIDTQTVCVVNLQSSGKELKIAGHAELPGPNSLEPTAQESQQLLEKLKKTFELAGVKPRVVNLVVPPEASMIRHFELPNMSKKEEKNAVRFEAQKYVPIDMKDLYFDHESYPDATKRKLRVVFFACKRQWVDQIATLLVPLGARLGRVELVSQSVTRGFRARLAKPSDEAEAMVLPSDASNAELVFFKEKSVLFTRHLSLLEQDSSAGTGFLVSELKLSLDYFYDNFKGEKVTKLHWIGASGESSRALSDILGKELSIGVENSDFLRSLGNGHSSTVPLAAAYGCAMAALRPEKGKRINLAPSEAVSAAPPANWLDEKKQLQELATKEGVAIVAGLFVLYFLSLSLVSAKNSDYNNLMETYPKTANATIQQPLAELQTKLSAVSEKANFATNFIDKRTFFTAKMDQLIRLVPRQIRLIAMKYTDQPNHFTGTSDLLFHIEGYIFQPDGGELSAINKFVNQLADNAEFMQGFSEIKISSTKKTVVNESPVTKFALDCVTARKA